MRSSAALLVLVAACRAKTPVAPQTRAVAPPPAIAVATTTAEAEEQGETAAQREARLEREDYARALDTATTAAQTCRADPTAVDVDALLDAYEILAPYEQSPARDAAIQALEQCRKLAVGHVQAVLPSDGWKSGDPSAKVRRAVDDKQKRTTKPLRFVVRGKHVTVEEKRNPERASKNPKTLQGHCAMSDAPTIDAGDIASAEAGEGACSGAFKFSEQGDYVVQRVGLTQPFLVESTEKRKTPPQ
ncbi:MAG TPA: hypothetical protein VG755_21455 [Nannocystaceae bacterium]|nr:hypothetical protein [Nannocystaceae bacterium]